MTKSVFYSFHYERDLYRVQLVRNIGALEGQPLLNAQEWEAVQAKGTNAVQQWIDSQMSYKRAVIVLIGRQTADRPFVQYEIDRAWNLRKPLLGIYIHGLSSMGVTDTPGADPFAKRGLSMRGVTRRFGHRLTPSIPIERSSNTVHMTSRIVTTSIALRM